MHLGGIGPGVTRLLTGQPAGALRELFPAGRILQAEVISVFENRAVLSFGRGARLEVALQAPLSEGDLVKVQVQPYETSRPDTVLLKILEQGSEAAAGAARQTAGESPVATQAQPAVVWLPIPLPDGRQGWAQLHVQEDEPGRGGHSASTAHRVRIWWETPGLGPIQVTLDAQGPRLATVLTVAGPESRSQVEGALPDLQQRLLAAGFAEARVGCRQPLPGEAVEPLRVDAGRLDKRL